MGNINLAPLQPLLLRWRAEGRARVMVEYVLESDFRLHTVRTYDPDREESFNGRLED